MWSEGSPFRLVSRVQESLSSLTFSSLHGHQVFKQYFSLFLSLCMQELQSLGLLKTRKGEGGEGEGKKGMKVKSGGGDKNRE